MADRKYLESIELLTGTGRIYEGPSEISTVRYRVEVLQEKIECRTSSGPNTADGLKEIRGTVDPIGASIYDLLDKTLTLVLEDGRKLDFFVPTRAPGRLLPVPGFISC